jgi:hypothetical protein
MHIEFQLPQGGVEGDIKAYDADGKEVKVARIVYTPFFFTPSSVPVVLYASLLSGANPPSGTPHARRVEQRSVLTVSGAKGRLRFQDRTTHVKPACEEKKNGTGTRNSG